MNYLKSFWKTLAKFTNRYKTQKKTFEPTDTLGRFLTSSRWFSEKNLRVKHNALMPMYNQETKKYETSIFNIQGLNEYEIKKIAKKYLLKNLNTGQSVYGTGNSDSNKINFKGLKAIESTPPNRHYLIVGWPSEKGEQKLIAMELENKFKLSLFHNTLIKE